MIMVPGVSGSQSLAERAAEARQRAAQMALRSKVLLRHAEDAAERAARAAQRAQELYEKRLWPKLSAPEDGV